MVMKNTQLVLASGTLPKAVRERQFPMPPSVDSWMGLLKHKLWVPTKGWPVVMVWDMIGVV